MTSTESSHGCVCRRTAVNGVAEYSVDFIRMSAREQKRRRPLWVAGELKLRGAAREWLSEISNNLAPKKSQNQ